MLSSEASITQPWQLPGRAGSTFCSGHCTMLHWGRSCLQGSPCSQKLQCCSGTGDAPISLVQHQAGDGMRSHPGGALGKVIPKAPLAPQRLQAQGEPGGAYLEPCGSSRCRELEGSGVMGAPGGTTSGPPPASGPRIGPCPQPRHLQGDTAGALSPWCCSSELFHPCELSSGHGC